ATLQAANAIRKTLLERASMKFEEAPDNLDLVDGKVIVREDPSQNMPLKELIAICASEGLPLSNLAMFKAPFTVPLDPETGQGDVWPDFTFGCHGLEVAVDTETGEVTVLKSVASHDVGRAINPHSAEGQIQGGSHQGLGWAMMEDLALKDGRIRAGSLSEYLIPTSCDLPETKVIMLESGSGVGPFGAKGIGEPALTPAAPAYANAVSNAIGARIYDIPITPERVLEAVARAKKGQ
ncbi:MAG TPA: molybdopterin-dependent oxidoreductase, partial [Bellilinea sp.]|nr:molybdopterin-dependent oxidoreductase [Bellilinea sp.]